MPAGALIKLSQVTVSPIPDGRALIGVLSQVVTVANSVNTQVLSWQIDLVYSDPASAVAIAIPLAFNNNNATPTTTFTPDVRRSYRFVLKVWSVINRVGAPDSQDIRVFTVPELNGNIIPPSQVWPSTLPDPQSGQAGNQPNEMNFGGQAFGWAGTSTDGLANQALIRSLKAPVSPGDNNKVPYASSGAIAYTNRVQVVNSGLSLQLGDPTDSPASTGLVRFSSNFDIRSNTGNHRIIESDGTVLTFGSSDEQTTVEGQTLILTNTGPATFIIQNTSAGEAITVTSSNGTILLDATTSKLDLTGGVANLIGDSAGLAPTILAQTVGSTASLEGQINGTNIFKYVRDTGVQRISVFNQTPAVQQATTDIPSLLQALKNYGWLTTGSTLAIAINNSPAELALVANVVNSTISTYARIGARRIDLTAYPATVGSLTRTVLFVANLDRGSGATSSQVKLFNITDNENVTNADLTSASLSNSEQVSASLTVGSSPGMLRNNYAAQYEVYLKMNGGTPGVDLVSCTNARLVITYS